MTMCRDQRSYDTNRVLESYRVCDILNRICREAPLHADKPRVAGNRFSK